MCITAIFGSVDAADLAAHAIAREVPLSGRRIVPLDGAEPAPPYAEQPAFLAQGLENAAVTGGAAFSGFGDVPLLWTYITPEQADNGTAGEARLELDIRAADAAHVETLLYNLHGRAVTNF